MQINKWTIALVATGVVSFAAQAEETHPISSAISGTTLSGYVDASGIWNFGRGNGVAPRAANTGPDRQDGFNLNAVKLALEKPLDEGTWSAGYKFEGLFGPDSRDLPGKVGDQVAIKQAYIAVRAPVGNGIDFKLGHFDPIVGYEVFDSYANPNFSRSFGYALEPLGHTGILATYQFNEVFGASAGVANSGSLNGTAFVAGGATAESVKNYMASVVAKAPESTGWLAGSSLYAGVVDGGIRNGKDSLLVYVGGTMSTPWKELTVGAAFDYVNHVNGLRGHANAFAFYASYQVTEKLKLNNRFEYATMSNAFNVDDGAEGFFTRSSKIVADTITADYALWANVVTRLEFRWDHGANGLTRFGGQRNDLSLAANVIYKF
jgi:hypothetical protein